MDEKVRFVTLKLERAGAQIQALCKEISDWTTSHPIKVDVELREGRHGYRIVQKDYAEAPPLEQWGLTLGECIHNLRSALDNLAYALARLEQDPPLKPNKIAFPIFQEQAQFAKTGKLNINQLPQAAAEVIEQLQPFQRNNPGNLTNPDQDPLALLQWLSNTDKHRVPSVVLLSATEWSHNISMEFRSDEDAEANVPPDITHWAGPLSPGTVLMEWRTNCPIESTTGTLEGKATVFFEAASGPVPLVEMLVGLHQYTALIANQFGHFFSPPPVA